MPQPALLSSELIQAQLSQIDLLTAMYPGEGEVLIDEATKTWLQNLEEWCQNDHNDNTYRSQNTNDQANSLSGIPEYLSLSLNLAVNTDTRTESVAVHIDVSIRSASTPSSTPTSPPPPWKLRLRQPPWLSRTQTSDINTTLAHECAQTDPFSALEHLRDSIAGHLSPSSPPSPQSLSASQWSPSLVRAWFYFPSLSTRAKRDDLVSAAPRHGLTGFVLAGKPGLLCLEGRASDIDAYMRYVKTESWGDIPSHQKKVSERYRETIAEGERRSSDMQEITEQEWMGERRGERGNRSDMRVVEGWLRERGLEGVLQKVLM